MSQFEKFKKRVMRDKAPRDIMPDELKSFLKKYGFVHKRTCGSHFVYEYPTGNGSISIPMAKPIKLAYIEELRDIITKLEEGN